MYSLLQGRSAISLAEHPHLLWSPKWDHNSSAFSISYLILLQALGHPICDIDPPEDRSDQTLIISETIVFLKQEGPCRGSIAAEEMLVVQGPQLSTSRYTEDPAISKRLLGWRHQGEIVCRQRTWAVSNARVACRVLVQEGIRGSCSSTMRSQIIPTSQLLNSNTARLSADQNHQETYCQDEDHRNVVCRRRHPRSRCPERRCRLLRWRELAKPRRGTVDHRNVVQKTVAEPFESTRCVRHFASRFTPLSRTIRWPSG